MKSIDYKAPNGKLLRIDYEAINDEIKAIKIYGDFFMYPEDGINKLEEALIGTKNNIKERLEEVIRKNNITIIGFNSDDIENVIKNI